MFTIVGAVFELVALAFVVLDLRGVRDQASAYLRQPGASLEEASQPTPEMSEHERE